MEKHKFATISLTMRDRVISSKFSTHRVSDQCTLGNFQKIFPSPKMAAILNFRIFTKNGKHKFASVYLTVRDRATNAKRHEAEIIYMYTNKYLSIIDIFYK